MQNTPYTVELITTEDALGRIKSDWKRISRAVDFPNVFASYDWFNTWYTYFAKERAPVSSAKRPGLEARWSGERHCAAGRKRLQ